jgi:hypothetical protein
MTARNVLRCAMMAAVPFLTICGCSGEVGYHASGKVTFDGKPIPVGKIYFVPDTGKGNSGATGFADIKDGAYDTASATGKKHIGGPMIVKIEGFDPAAKGPESPDDTSGEVTIKSLFPTYETPAELAKSGGTKDFDVPASAADRQIQPETGVQHSGP